MAPFAPPCIRFMMNSQKATISATGSSRPSRPDHHGWRVLFTSTSPPLVRISFSRSTFGTGVTALNFTPSFFSPVMESPRTTTDLICCDSTAVISSE